MKLSSSGLCYGFLLIFCAVACVAKEQKIQSIQGKEYSDRKNGIYDASISDVEVEGFLNKLKEAVKRNNKDEVAMLFFYPFKFNCNVCKKKQNQITSKRLFKKRYKVIMSKKIKEAIVKASLDSLFVNYQGFMIGNGEVWFDPRKGITAING